MTEKLTAFVAGLKPSPWRHAWVGDISGVRLSHRPYEIARRAGLAPEPGVFVPIDRNLAAQILAYVQSESLAHGRKRYRETYFREAKTMLSELGDTAEFWSNSNYDGCFAGGEESGAWGFKSLTSNVFDTGIVGCSASQGFAYWVEESD